MRDFYAVGICGVGYFGAVHIIYPYGASGSREVEHVCHGVRVEGESLLGSGFGYVGSSGALMLTRSSGYVDMALPVLQLPVFGCGVIFVGGKDDSVV